MVHQDERFIKVSTHLFLQGHSLADITQDGMLNELRLVYDGEDPRERFGGVCSRLGSIQHHIDHGSEIKADDFNSFLTHCLVTHGLGLFWTHFTGCLLTAQP